MAEEKSVFSKVEEETDAPLDIYVDLAAEEAKIKKRRKIKFLVFSAISIIIIGSVGAGLTYLFTDSVTPQPTISVAPTSTPGITYAWPVKNAFKNLSPFSPREITLKVDQNSSTVISSPENKINFSSIPGVELVAPGSACKVSDETDFCFAGQLVTSSSKSMMYYFNNAVDSQFFKEATDFKLDEAKKAALMTTSFGGTKTSLILIVLPDRSGLAITFDDLSTAQAFFEAYRKN